MNSHPSATGKPCLFCVCEGAYTASYCGACDRTLKEQTHRGLQRVSKDVFPGLFLQASATRSGAAAAAQEVLRRLFIIVLKVVVCSQTNGST